MFEVVEKHKGICGHCLTKIRRYSGNIFQVLQIGVNLNEEITVAHQWGCRYCVMFNLSETVLCQKWQGFAFISADQSWTGKARILQLSVMPHLETSALTCA